MTRCRSRRPHVLLPPCPTVGDAPARVTQTGDSQRLVQIGGHGQVSEVPQGVLEIVWSEAHGDSRVLLTGLSVTTSPSARLLAILLPLTLLALVSLVCIGGFGDQP